MPSTQRPSRMGPFSATSTASASRLQARVKLSVRGKIPCEDILGGWKHLRGQLTRASGRSRRQPVQIPGNDRTRRGSSLRSSCQAQTHYHQTDPHVASYSPRVTQTTRSRSAPPPLLSRSLPVSISPITNSISIPTNTQSTSELDQLGEPAPAPKSGPTGGYPGPGSSEPRRTRTSVVSTLGELLSPNAPRSRILLCSVRHRPAGPVPHTPSNHHARTHPNQPESGAMRFALPLIAAYALSFGACCPPRTSRLLTPTQSPPRRTSAPRSASRSSNAAQRPSATRWRRGFASSLLSTTSRAPPSCLREPDRQLMRSVDFAERPRLKSPIRSLEPRRQKSP